MSIKLSHIGEELIAEMLRSLAQRHELDRVVCAVSRRSLAKDIQEADLGEPLAFRAEDASLIVRDDGLAYACDGEQKVDVLCTGEYRAIAFEAKLGETRMGSAEFRRRFCTRCEKSKHTDLRLSGSMVAVLERSLPFDGAPALIGEIEGDQWTLVQPWWLVVRQSVVDKWRGDIPVTSARVLIFDSLVQAYGSRQQFDQLVQRVVGADFAGRWGIRLNDP